MNTAPNPNPVDEPPSAPAPWLARILFPTAIALLALAAAYLYWFVGPAFRSFPDRTIGISLLSDVDPHFRTYLFLLLSALAIAIVAALFVFSRWRLGLRWQLAGDSIGNLLLACAAANGLAAVFLPQVDLYLATAALALFILVLWRWECMGEGEPDASAFLLRLVAAWQVTTLLFWFAAWTPGLTFLPVCLAFYLLLRWWLSSPSPFHSVLLTVVLAAPLALVLAMEFAYFSFGEKNSTAGVVGWWLLLLLPLGLYGLKDRPLQRQACEAAFFLLVSTAALNEYTATIRYGAYDVFHLAERLLPIQQAASYGLYPIIDFQSAHGLFDVLPHTLYQWLNGGPPLESMIWGNGYFHGWFMRAIYAGLFYLLLASLLGPGIAFYLLWLLPHFHLVEPYNTLFLIPLFGIAWLASGKRPVAAWILLWGLVPLLTLWRPDFGLVLAAGNVVLLVVLSWYDGDARHLRPSLLSALAIAVISFGSAWLALGPAALSELRAWMQPYMGIQVLAASYDHFYKRWDYMATSQYLLMPALGAMAGGYALARLYLRQDRQQLLLYLLVVFLTAIGFAMAIRLFHRHTIAEGFSKPYFFLLAPMLLLLALRMQRRLLAPLLAFFIMLTFLAAPKMRHHPDDSLWGPQRTYPLAATAKALPELAPSQPRLEDSVTRFDNFLDFTGSFLRPGETFYDFSNAPLLYALADVELPTYVMEAVYHSSETMQRLVLNDLARLHRERRLPFVVFRQNNPWDTLDGVDNALRGFRVAEFMYGHYRPCVKIGKLELWLDRRRNCQGELASRAPAGFVEREGVQLLGRDYLEQQIDYGHLPYIWANFDDYPAVDGQSLDLPLRAASLREKHLGPAKFAFCFGEGCYLDLELSSERLQKLTLVFKGQEQLSLSVRPGTHRYRTRISSLWRWFRGGSFERMKLRGERPFKLLAASLVAEAEPALATRP